MGSAVYKILPYQDAGASRTMARPPVPTSPRKPRSRRRSRRRAVPCAMAIRSRSRRLRARRTSMRELEPCCDGRFFSS
jgi:hypothetical protein